MNNSFYGKTCEDVRKYTDVKIVTSEKGSLKTFEIYHGNFATVMMEKRSVTLNQPRCIGASILALSKTIMYNFHYNYIMKKLTDCKLLFTDTDCLCYF